MPILEDGTVIPSFLQVQDQIPRYSSTDPFMRVGRIIKSHAPTASTNLSQTFWEYDVAIEHTDGNGTHTRIVYPRAKIMSNFGGIADKTSFTPRIANAQPDEISKGSYVLLLCINGDVKQSYIIGGVPHPNTKDEDIGHNLNFTFNGVNFNIDKDGKLEVNILGATDEEGNVQNSEGSSKLEFFKDGSVTITTTGKISVNTNSTVEIDSKQVLLGASRATDSLIKGTTYRTQEQLLHQTLITQLNGLAAAFTEAAALFTTAGGTLAASSVLASPQFIAAAAGLGACTAIVESMVLAITSFEAQSGIYLSVNKTE